MTDEAERPDSESVANQSNEPPMKRLIGSQRNPEAYRPEPTIPVVGGSLSKQETEKKKEDAESIAPVELKTVSYPPENGNELEAPNVAIDSKKTEPEDLEDDEMPDHLSEDGEKSLKKISVRSSQKVELPRFRGGKLSDDLEDEFNAVFGDNSANESFDSLMSQSEALADQEVLEPDTKVKAKVLAIRGDSVFLDVGAREQGVVLLNIFPPDAEPKVGDEVDVTILRLEDGLYEVSVPMAAADVRDWSQVHEGMIVEARITKTNNGGLECEVNRLRGFIPISQIDIFRVEDTEQYVGQKMNCIVEEVNVERRNLVLSRRALLNRERDEKKAQILEELKVGQVREGLIRKIIDAGAFVDLGGVDGFIPISKISWGRINHPSDVLTEGSRVKVKVDRIEEGTNRISLIYRDDSTNPWANIGEHFQERSPATGRVSKIMDFGAFVELMPGVEGLIHISELSHKRVNNVREVVKEGDRVEVYVVSIDPQAKRIALSIKQLAPEPIVENKEDSKAEDVKPDVLPPPVKHNRKKDAPLKGGTAGDGAGNPFGLKW